MFENYPDVLTVSDLQNALGIGRSMAYRLIRNGYIRHLKIGRKIKVPRRYLIDYVESTCYNNIIATNPPSQEVKEV